MIEAYGIKRVAALLRRSPAEVRVGAAEGQGRRARLSLGIDAESERFEEALLNRQRDLPLPQRHAYLRHCGREVRLLQLEDPAGRPAWQVAVTIYRPRRLPLLGHGVAHKLGPAASPEDEAAGLRLLRDLLREQGDILTLRLQPRRARLRDLWDFEGRARHAGYTLCEPDGVTRTVLCPLRESREALLSAMSPKTRRNLRSGERFDGALRVLDDPVWAPACQAAVRAAALRTGVHLDGGAGGGDRHLRALLHVAKARPDLVRVVGLFLPERPTELLAFATACNHGLVAEYLSAGSLPDPALRKLPFNYWLLGSLFDWAREQGCAAFDMGGITEGGPEDPLAGISAFKRHLSSEEDETEVGREMRISLQPGLALMLEGLRALRDRGLP